MEKKRIILASGSPRRKELLEQIGICPQICPSNAEEKKDETDPQKLVEKLSSVKAEDVAGCFPAGTLVIGADTVVSIVKDGESDPVILGKPAIFSYSDTVCKNRSHCRYYRYKQMLLLSLCCFREDDGSHCWDHTPFSSLFSPWKFQVSVLLHIKMDFHLTELRPVHISC